MICRFSWEEGHALLGNWAPRSKLRWSISKQNVALFSRIQNDHVWGLSLQWLILSSFLERSKITDKIEVSQVRCTAQPAELAPGGPVQLTRFSKWQTAKTFWFYFRFFTLTDNSCSVKGNRSNQFSFFLLPFSLFFFSGCVCLRILKGLTVNHCHGNSHLLCWPPLRTSKCCSG